MYACLETSFLLYYINFIGTEIEMYVNKKTVWETVWYMYNTNVLEQTLACYMYFSFYIYYESKIHTSCTLILQMKNNNSKYNQFIGHFHSSVEYTQK